MGQQETRDCYSPRKRSDVMRQVKSRDTQPEMLVRRMLHQLGYRYRLHSKDLPGRPDLVFRSRKKIIFVNGCFWHGHSCSRGKRVPANNRTYWIEKIARNKQRDLQNHRQLRRLGWSVTVVWECQLRNPNKVKDRLCKFLGPVGVA